MSLAGSPRYQRYGGTNRVNRSVVTGIADDSVDDLLFRTRMAATAHNPHASSLHQAAAEVYALTGSTMYSDRLRVADRGAIAVSSQFAHITTLVVRADNNKVGIGAITSGN